ncbi:Stress response protein nst1 [Dissophora globulifera]|nr:Stress response protein nst1 [Dissophora globulifera]
MAAHTFAPEDALPPPKSAVIYSRDGRKRSLNIDMTKHLAPAPHDHTTIPPPPPITSTSARDASADASNGSREPSHSDPNGTISTIAPTASLSSSVHKKKKKKKTKKRTPLDRIEDSDNRAGPGSRGADASQHHSHHAGCQHDHGRTHHHHHHYESGHHHHHEDEDDDEDDDFYSDDDAYDPETPALASSAGQGSGYSGAQVNAGPSAAPLAHQAVNGHSESSSSKKKKKKRKKSSTTGAMPPLSTSENHHNHINHVHSTSGGDGPSSKAMVQSGHRNGHDRSMVKHMHDGHTQNDGFWHYSDAEERQRIREFWFQLREEERRSLVRVEKEAVLKKMKEQQRHSCSCSLCGRKRTAIEEELELLYDAYYDELEQYANQQQPDGHALTYSQHSPTFEDDDLSDESRPSDEEDEEDEDEDEEDEEDEEGYEDEDEDEEYEEEINNRKTPFPYRNGFPNTLQAKGNILTVAEDLLENDGKKFLEMMDRLADRKVQRDDEMMDNRGVYEEYDDEEDGDYEDEGPEEDALTKEQRMEEGRRMFQAFAARMFEQRVLSAYREKVAQERQERLLAELEEESRQEQLREERREREKEKKRDKKRQQRQQKEEERAAKEAQRLAEERRLLEERERKLEAERKRREEERRAKEEEKRLREEERLKKDEERKRKAKEEKARELEKERKRKEEQLAKEQEEQERKASEARKAEQSAAQAEASRSERESYLKQQLAEEQRRQEELRQQEQQAQQDLAKQELEHPFSVISASVPDTAPAPGPAPVAATSSNSPRSSIPESAGPVTSGRNRVSTSSSDVSIASPIELLSTSPVRAPESRSSQPIATQGLTSTAAGNLWSNTYPSQAVPQPQLQQMFSQPMQQSLFRPSSHFGHIGSDLDGFTSRMSHSAGRGAYLTAAHQSPASFQSLSQHQQPSTVLPQQLGGMRSPGLTPIGYGQTNVPPKQLLTLMNPNAPASHDMSTSAGSPLHSPSTLGAIGTPIGSYGPISPIGHTRRTSTPYGPTSMDTIKPIQRPVPIGRPKDHQHHSGSGTIASSFDGLSLGLSGLTIGSDLERRSRSPPLNLTGVGGSSLDLDSVGLGTESLRSLNGVGESHSHAFSNEGAQALSPTSRNQNETSFFNPFFGSRINGNDPFLQSSDFSSFGQQQHQQSHGSLPNAHFMSPYPMHMPSSPHSQHQQQHTAQQQQLYLQQQYMHPTMQDLHQQQPLRLNSPPLNGGASSSWSRTNFMRPPHLSNSNGLGFERLIDIVVGTVKSAVTATVIEWQWWEWVT